MNILLLTDKMDMGGAETHLLSLAAELKRLGHRITVASSGGRCTKRLRAVGIRHITLPLSAKSPLCLATSFLALGLLLKKERFHLVHSHARLPSAIASPIAKSLKLPLICTAHARFSISPLTRRFSRWGHSTIAVSQDLKQYLVSAYCLPPEKITVIPNGIDAAVFYPAETICEAKRIVFLSRLDADCSLGAELLCSVAPGLCKAFGPIEIVIGGGGDELKRLTQRAKETNGTLGFECIRIIGRVEDVPSLLRQARVFVGVSRAALEAAFCAVPVVLCGNEGFFGRLTLGNIDYAAASNFCGRDCAGATEDRLFSAISDALKDSAISDAADLRRRIKDIYSAEKMAKNTVEVYRRASAPTGRAHTILCGYYGFGNMGDDILLRSAIDRAGAGVCALTKHPRRDEMNFGVRCYNRRIPRRVLFCKHLVLGGGTLLQENTSLLSLCYYAALIFAAKLTGARVSLWGNGIGAPRTPTGRYILTRALRACDYIGLRDRVSVRLATALCPEKMITPEPDLAEGVLPCRKDRERYLIGRLFGKKIPPFVIVAAKKDRSLPQLCAALTAARKKSFQLIFVAMHEGEDRKISRALCKKYGGRVLKGICYSDLVALARHSNGVYSMRFHALLAAKTAGVPYYPFGSDGKIKNFE